MFYKDLVANRPIYNIMETRRFIMMSRSSFNDIMRQLYRLTTDELSEAWDTYKEAVDTLETGNRTQVSVMQNLPMLNSEMRLRWRTNMAEQGIEMTPIQVDQYMSILELAMEI